MQLAEFFELVLNLTQFYANNTLSSNKKKSDGTIKVGFFRLMARYLIMPFINSKKNYFKNGLNPYFIDSLMT